MAMEVVCGNCQGRLLVEHTGVVVACPHCGAHLQIGEPAAPVAEVPPPVETPPPPIPPFVPFQPEPATPSPSASPFAQFGQAEFISPPKPAAPPSTPAAATPVVPPPIPAAIPASTSDGSTFPSFDFLNTETTPANAPTEPRFSDFNLTSETSEVPLPVDLAPASQPASSVPEAAASAPPALAQFHAPEQATAPAAPPAAATTPETSPVRVAFETEPIATVQFKPEADTKLPDINLTSPAVVPTPTVETTAEPAEVPVWGAPRQVTPTLESDPTATDSWMPQINLELPANLAPASATADVPAASTQSTPPMAEPETATNLAPAMPAIDTSPSTVNLSPPTATGAAANQTDIWSPVRLDDAGPPEPAAFPGAEPAAVSFGSAPPTPVVWTPVSAPTSEAAISPANQETVAQAAAAVVTAAPVTAEAASQDTAATTPAEGTGIGEFPAYVPRGATVPRLYFIMMASYASAITLAFVYLWLRAGTSTLDLPDIRPPVDKKTGQIGANLITDPILPPAYRLKLGESKRYGNLMVTPVKVTRGPLQFVHYNDQKLSRPPSESDVLKLWIKFENVSEDQTFPVLDEQLVYQRHRDRKHPGQERSNNYVCLQSEQVKGGAKVPLYPFAIKGDWLLKDQNLDKPVAPHETWETYLPTTDDEDLNELEGPLCWRVQFRKGYNPESHWGVTTLVEVEFDSEEIQADS